MKKKRLDDIMFGLGAAKGVTLDQASNDGNSSTVKSSLDTKVPELNKLQDLLGRPGNNKRYIFSVMLVFILSAISGNYSFTPFHTSLTGLQLIF